MLSVSEMLTMLQIKDYFFFFPSSTQKREGNTLMPCCAFDEISYNTKIDSGGSWKDRSLKYYTMSNYCCFFNVLIHQIYYCRKEQRKHNTITAETVAFLCKTQIALCKPQTNTEQTRE